MSISSNDYHGLWRASANEGVPYSEDFPEALLVLPEFIDGALGAGEASIIDIKFNITNPTECELIVNDNGKGLISEKRMKEWSSKDIGNNKTENIYGHGSKKALTKFCIDYNNAKWKLYWRKQDKKGHSSSLYTLTSPYNGLDTKHTEDEDNEDIVPEHGTCWKINFDISVLGKINTPEEIMSAMQEIIRVRYEPSYYHKYIINIEVIKDLNKIKKSSKNWKSLKQCLESEISTGKTSKITKIRSLNTKLDNTTIDFSLYRIDEDGRKYNIPDFPTFGKKNMNSSRIHIARNGRYIEAMPYAKFMGKEYHNSDNGKIGFIIFTGEELPTPCTTKVKMQEECPIFKKMVNLIIENINNEILDPKPVPEPKQPKQKIVIKKLVPEPNQRPVPEPNPRPVPEPNQRPVPEPNPRPVPEPNPRPVPEPNQRPVPEPNPRPVPEPNPRPVPEPNPKPEIINISKDDTKILEKLYIKYGYKILIEKINEIHNDD